MIRNPLLFVATSDFSGKLRGKAFPASAFDQRAHRGVGWTPTNVQITCFDKIAASPYGALGDLLLVPDPDTHTHVDFEDGTPPENFMLGNIVSLQGEPWECCTRSLLQSALAQLKSVSGLELKAAFEHEFHLKGGARPVGDAYTYAGYRANAAFAETVMAALDVSGLKADTFMREYGADQYEVTIEPSIGIRAADTSAILRSLVCASAERLGREASFTPIRAPGAVGNGVHIHMSLVDADGQPATYDPLGPHGMSAVTAAFIAGVLKHIDAITAFTAPSAISYMRLQPHRWSAAFNNLGIRDREATMRICPTTATDPEGIARQYNFEFRAADSAASPYLALAAIVFAGVQGIKDKLPAPEPTEEDLDALGDSDLAARGFTKLPQSLGEALDRFASNTTAQNWFPGRAADIYRDHKLAELDHVKDLDDAARCAAYEEVY